MSAGPHQPDAQAEFNDRLWARRDLVRFYAKSHLDPAEEQILATFREAFTGRVLELGCGAGRVTRHLAALSDDVRAIDISPAMVEACREACPTVAVAVGNIRDLSGIEPGSCDVVAAWCNIIDVLDDDARCEALRQIHACLAPGGLVAFSTHNLANAPTNRRPTDLRFTEPLGLAADLVRLPRALYNSRRVARHERRGDGYAILNDVSHDFMGLHYYVARDLEERRLASLGFTVLECRATDGRVLPPGDVAADSAHLHLVARR